jgi:Transmembrane domain of unknown function (DUF3566)
VSDRSSGTGADPNARPDAPAPSDAPATRAGGPYAETVKTVAGDPAANDQKFPPGTPARRRVEQPSVEPTATTEVYRPAAGVSMASNPTVSEKPPRPPGPGGPHPFGPGGPGAPAAPGIPGSPAGPPGNGQLPNPFGGSGGPEPMRRNEPGPQRPPIGRPTARPIPPVPARPQRAPRKASLQLRRFDPWSVFKLTLVLSVAMFLIWLVAVGVLYGILNGMGVWDNLNGTWNDLASVNEAEGSGEQLISAGRVFGISAVVGAVNVVLFTAFATVLAFVYNVSADLAGGIEVTLSERD